MIGGAGTLDAAVLCMLSVAFMELLLAVEVLSVAGLSEPAALNMLAALDLAQPLLASLGLGAVRYMLDGLAELLLAAELGGAVTVRRAVLSVLVRLSGADACCRGARNRISCTLMYSTCWSPLTSLSCCLLPRRAVVRASWTSLWSTSWSPWRSCCSSHRSLPAPGI